MLDFVIGAFSCEIGGMRQRLFNITFTYVLEVFLNGRQNTVTQVPTVVSGQCIGI